MMEETKLHLFVKVRAESYVMVFIASLTVARIYSHIEQIIHKVNGDTVKVHYLHEKEGVLIKEALLHDILNNGDEVTAVFAMKTEA